MKAGWRATGVGSMPGEDFAESLRIVLGELSAFPHVPEVPGRGTPAGMIGRTLGAIEHLGFDLQPNGWRLTDAPGIDHRRARSLLAQDLDAVEEHTQGYAGPLKVQITGPWTLAAGVEKPRGDKVLADVGARRDLAQALAEAVGDHLADVRRRVPGAELVLQLDEPALPAVMTGSVPTASGFHRHRAVDAPGASALLEPVIAAAGETPVVTHCCAAAVPIALLHGAGCAGVSLDLDRLGADDYEALGALLDGGGKAWLGVLPSIRPPHLPTPRGVGERVLRLLDMLGFDPDEVGEQLVITPACGLAGADPAYVRHALSVLTNAET